MEENREPVTQVSWLYPVDIKRQLRARVRIGDTFRVKIDENRRKKDSNNLQQCFLDQRTVEL